MYSVLYDNGCSIIHLVVKPKSKLGNNRATHKPPFDTSLGRPPFNSSSTGPGRGGGGAMGGANSKLPHVGGTGRAQQKSLKLVSKLLKFGII